MYLQRLEVDQKFDLERMSAWEFIDLAKPIFGPGTAVNVWNALGMAKLPA